MDMVGFAFGSTHPTPPWTWGLAYKRKGPAGIRAFRFNDVILYLPMAAGSVLVCGAGSLRGQGNPFRPMRPYSLASTGFM